MERVPLYKQNKVLGYIFIAIGVVGFILSSLFFIKILNGGIQLKWSDGTITPLFQVLQSIAMIIIGYSSIRNMRYYVEWNDKMIRYRTKESKKVIPIVIEEITAINIKVYKIEILAGQIIHIISLENCMYKEITKIKSMFQEVKNTHSAIS